MNRYIYLSFALTLLLLVGCQAPKKIVISESFGKAGSTADKEFFDQLFNGTNLNEYITPETLLLTGYHAGEFQMRRPVTYSESSEHIADHIYAMIGGQKVEGRAGIDENGYSYFFRLKSQSQEHVTNYFCVRYNPVDRKIITIRVFSHLGVGT